jgi:hypothetical protein
MSVYDSDPTRPTGRWKEAWESHRLKGPNKWAATGAFEETMKRIIASIIFAAFFAPSV